MRRSALAFAVAMIVGCGEPSTPEGSALDDARELWQASKVTCPDYYYDRQDAQRLLAPVRDVTTVQIEDGVVVWRWFVDGLSVPDGGSGEAWVERGAELGTHPRGSPALTVEQLFDECEGIVRDNAGDPRLELAFDKSGVPVRCLMMTASCRDACAIGIDIGRFKCGTIQPGSSPPPTPPDGGTD